MIGIGIDVGAKTIKVVVQKDGAILVKDKTPAGFDVLDSTNKLLDELLGKAGLSREDADVITSTGSGRKEIDFALNSVTDVTADVAGVISQYPEARTIIDVGAEEGRSIRCDENGKIIDFAVNEKCAAGSGAFTEAMARALEIPIDEFGKLALQSTKEIPMNAQCAVFAESEVVSLLHAKTPKEDISRAVNDAIASRIISMVKKVGYENEIVLIGGVAFNVGFTEALKRDLESDIIIPEEPEFFGSLGASLIKGENSERK
ncbi:acyl-CoA dehydratase activase [candidate division KSB1 bacterium]